MSTYTNELGTTQPSPVRRLVAAGIKRGNRPWLVEQPEQSAADKAAHDEATYVRLTPDAITGDELHDRIKMDIWNAEGGEYASDFAVAELMAMGRRAVAVFASVTGHEYSSDWSARNTYPASLADEARALVRRQPSLV